MARRRARRCSRVERAASSPRLTPSRSSIRALGQSAAAAGARPPHRRGSDDSIRRTTVSPIEPARDGLARATGQPCRRARRDRRPRVRSTGGELSDRHLRLRTLDDIVGQHVRNRSARSPAHRTTTGSARAGRGCEATRQSRRPTDRLRRTVIGDGCARADHPRRRRRRRRRASARLRRELRALSGPTARSDAGAPVRARDVSRTSATTARMSDPEAASATASRSTAARVNRLQDADGDEVRDHRRAADRDERRAECRSPERCPSSSRR